MLSLLHIENIAVIEQAEISFSGGLNVLTGETGAGKSIVIDAISAILGQRTYRDVIRTGCDHASVRAVFIGTPPVDWFADQNVPYEKDELLISREIHSDGKNICSVNGKLVSVSSLRELGKSLVDIHGQNDTQTLFDEQTHIDFLDLMLKSRDALNAYSSAYMKYAERKTRLDRLTADEGERLRKTEMLRYQLKDIESVNLQNGEFEELSSRSKILRNAEKLSDSFQNAIFSLYGGEDSRGASDSLNDAELAISRLAGIDDHFCTWKERLKSLRCEAQDLAEEIRAEYEDLQFSAGELEQIEDRLDVISKLFKKYGGDEASVFNYEMKARAELDELENADSNLQILQEETEKAKNEAFRFAKILHTEREEAAELLKQRLETELSQLDMPNIRFSAELQDAALSEKGTDTVRFLMSANIGETLKPLSKVASGGELSRIMLGMKNVLAEKDRIQTQIFDEVDSGVSGRAAQRVAEKLLSVSKGKQVLCVTHLPQIAAIADVHLLISKAVRDGRTYTSVSELDRSGRIEELSRIIGGSNITENTRKSAEDMLKN